MVNKLILSVLFLFFVACGEDSSSIDDVTKKDVDMVDYYPNKDMSKSFLKTQQDKRDSIRETYTKNISVEENKLLYRRMNILKETILFRAEDIQILGDNNKTMKRFLEIGDSLYKQEIIAPLEEIMLGDIALGTKHKESKIECILEDKIEKLEDYGIPYKGDILKFKCISDSKIITQMKEDIPDYITLEDSEIQNDYDISYFYMKQELGIVAVINEDCMISGGDFEIINDKLSVCLNEASSYEFFLN